MPEPRTHSKPYQAVTPGLALTILLFGVQSSTGEHSRLSKRSDKREAPELVQLRREGNALFRRGQYLRAIDTYERGYQEAKRKGNLGSAVRFLNNLGGAQYLMFNYREAIRAYLEARDLAYSQGDRETLGALNVNLSSLYFEMGDTDAAMEAVAQGLKLPAVATAKFRAKLLTQAARIREERNDGGQAIALLKEAIETSREELDSSSEAQAWNELGNTFLHQGQIQSAERALVEAFRLRKFTDEDRLYFSYEALGNLRVRQGDLVSAVTLLDRAVESAGVHSPSAVWSAYYDRGRAKLAQGRLREAFDDFGYALKSARRWRTEVLPADAFRISTEVELHDVYSSFIELGSRLYEQSGERRFAEETFAAAEESRAASLRALWAGPDLTKRLPAAYWQTLAELHQEEASLVGDQRGDGRSAIHQLRLKLAEMEARAGLDFPVDPETFDGYDNKTMDRVRSTLRSTDVFLSFHLGNELSCLWVIDHEGLSLKTLPRRSRLAEDVRMFVEALRENSPTGTALGNRLYSELFGEIEGSRLDRPMWIVAPDGPLFELPFAALPAGSESDSDKHYLIERHAVQIVPGISALLGKEPLNLTGLAIGVGDPIYNRADSRLPQKLSFKRSHANSIPNSQIAPRLELARLVGSAREITSCARIWRDRGFEPVLLEGAAANKTNLVAALRRDPAVLHVAAHLLFPAQQEGVGLVALGLQPGGDLELLSATEISSMRINVGVVVLNACRSGQAPALPGAGLMGMTRAWMAAGAHAIIATRWPTADQEKGQLFQSFYSRLASVHLRRGEVAELLREAQLVELRAGGRRANPAYWAAYFCVERN